MIHAKLIPSLEKVFLDTPLDSLPEFRSVYAYRNSRISFQIALRADSRDPHRSFAGLRFTGLPADAVTFRSVDMIPSVMPVSPGGYDAGYVRTEPGLYPDLLSPLQMNGCPAVISYQTRTVWVDVDMSRVEPQDTAYDLEAVFTVCAGEQEIPLSLTLKALPVSLPEQDFKVTQWFHCDCLAQFYHTEVFSERHWEIIENFMKTAVRNGINTILTPVFTPPLDTHIGGERLTVQLIGVRRFANGRYKFDFSLLDRWIETADRVGVRYFEISHLFTQWGAAHAPKVMATTPNGYERIFGWDTEAAGREYKRFLRRFLTEFLQHMKDRGDDRRCIFHISDEPNGQQLEQYLRSKAVVADLLEGYTVIDALSNVDFYLSGAVETPVPSNNHIEPFIEAFRERGATGLWTYYCCGQTVNVSNRFFAMPGARTRFIGFQFFKYDIAGFLQWGYNFYNNQGSYDPINPYADSTGNYFVPSGDTYSVYPGLDGTALESVRINHFREGLDDLRALRLCASLIGKEATVAAAEEICGNIVFSRCVCDSVTMLRLREKIDSLIAAHL